MTSAKGSSLGRPEEPAEQHTPDLSPETVQGATLSHVPESEGSFTLSAPTCTFKELQRHQGVKPGMWICVQKTLKRLNLSKGSLRRPPTNASIRQIRGIMGAEYTTDPSSGQPSVQAKSFHLLSGDSVELLH